MLLTTLFFLVTLGDAARTQGCGKATPQGGLTTLQTRSGNRQYYLHVPKGYDSSKPSPLIVMHHGYNGDQAGIRDTTQFDNDTINPHYVTAFPNGNPDSAVSPGRNWEGEYDFPNVATHNDVQFIGDLLDDVSSKLCLNTSRFYAAGFSNGGGWTNSIACNGTLGTRFAAFGVHSGPFWYGSENLNQTKPASGTGCKPMRKVTPIIDIHGFNDTHIKYAGQPLLIPNDTGVEEGARYTGVQEWLGRWATRNNCKSVATITPHQGYYFQQWDGCALEHYNVTHLGHEWAGPKAAIYATAKMLNFFDRH